MHATTKGKFKEVENQVWDKILNTKLKRRKL